MERELVMLLEPRYREWDPCSTYKNWWSCEEMTRHQRNGICSVRKLWSKSWKRTESSCAIIFLETKKESSTPISICGNWFPKKQRIQEEQSFLLSLFLWLVSSLLVRYYKPRPSDAAAFCRGTPIPIYLNSVGCLTLTTTTHRTHQR